MRALFLGTPAAAIPTLAALGGVVDVIGVVTQPDASRGRGKRKAAPPVKQAAEEWGIPVMQPATAPDLLTVVRSAHCDIGVVVAYGRILEADVLAVPLFGLINVHFSLLPRWRGAAPVERAILAGDESTGVSIMKLDRGLDTGPVIAVREIQIDADDTAGGVTARLAHIGADLLIDSINDYVAGRRVPAPQILGAGKLAPRLTTAEAQMAGSTEVGHAARMVRAFNPRPGAWMRVEGERLKVFTAETVGTAVPPGTLAFPSDLPVVGFAGGSLELVSVQPAGHKIMSGEAWGNGRRHAPATIDPIQQ